MFSMPLLKHTKKSCSQKFVKHLTNHDNSPLGRITLQGPDPTCKVVVLKDDQVVDKKLSLQEFLQPQSQNKLN